MKRIGQEAWQPWDEEDELDEDWPGSGPAPDLQLHVMNGHGHAPEYAEQQVGGCAAAACVHSVGLTLHKPAQGLQEDTRPIILFDL